ncbi:SDR family oxidoreductase [Massilia sp. erpn]|uniref:SDR family oxidoreductase n=1 Tax=Massilia sp. erpn TaxID=2738142 RepID=UPI0021046326|nr:SDR family oxidoreductase [Massilia sp. erpn]UTY60016.1 SDR family oxidoreductase [Massilia sp. erpn]
MATNTQPPATPAGNQQRDIQQQQDARDHAGNGPQQQRGPMQAGHHDFPVPPLPQQHLEKPGIEAGMSLKPQFQAPAYCGSGKLHGMAAIITGGDSGIGRAVAVLYAREGADVALVYLAEEQEDAEATRHSVEAEGQRCLLLPGDVREMAFCRQAVESTLREFGRLDILVNNAAFQEHAARLEELSEERFDLTMKTNIYGYFHMAKAALPHLKRGSAIINTGSVVGLRGSRHLLDYSATKGAIHAFTMSLAANLMEQGVRVNAVAPGPVWTPLNPADQTGEKIAQFGADTDMRRPAQPEELSPAYVFLAAPCCSSYISGIVLPVTGSVGG